MNSENTKQMTEQRTEQAKSISSRARAASRLMARASSKQKNAALLQIAADLAGEGERGQQAVARVLAANAVDMQRAQENHMSAALLDRLKLDEKRLKDLAQAVKHIAQLPDPIGKIEDLTVQPSGIQVGRMYVPLGAILIVYEARPGVTVDAAALCLKAGNAVVLRAGKEALASSIALAHIVRNALQEQQLPVDAALPVEDPERQLLYALLGCSGDIDLAIPRGGTALIDAVNQHARMPVVQHYQGICHVYVHEKADFDVAERVTINAKAQRSGVCNAMECLLVDQSVADAFLPSMMQTFAKYHVQVRACETTMKIVQQAEIAQDHITKADDKDFDTEFLSLICAVKVVENYQDAIQFLEKHGSQHTEAIITQDHNVAMQFLRDVDASCVLINASTRFNDGGELGLGAELGISTTKLHAYGPMGLQELCARKFVVLGHGEVRGNLP